MTEQRERFIKLFIQFEAAKIISGAREKKLTGKVKCAIQQLRFDTQFKNIYDGDSTFPIKHNSFPLPPLCLRDTFGIPQGVSPPHYSFPGMSDLISGQQTKHGAYQTVVEQNSAKAFREAEFLLN